MVLNFDNFLWRYWPDSCLERFQGPVKQAHNIVLISGLVQVAGSMSSCIGWAPISLMSHNFDASDGSIATAVGWGLDRYGQ